VLTEKEHLWASRKPSKRALQLAFYTGLATVSERNGMLKTYELTARHFGWDSLPKPATAAEATAYLLDRGLRAQALSAWIRSASRRAEQPAVRRLIERRVDARNWCRSRSKARPRSRIGRRPKRWRITRTTEARARRSCTSSRVRSADHPAKRTHLFFDYEHRFEAYVPKEEAPVRLFRAAGRGRLRHRRRAGSQDRPAEQEAPDAEMEWSARQGREGRRAQALKRRIEEELDRFARFQLAE